MAQQTTSIGFGRQLSLLSEGDKFQKSKALALTKDDLVQDKLTRVDVDELLKAIIVVLSDATERVREQSIDIVAILLNKEYVNTGDVLRVFVPFLVKRIGQQDVLEPSEELRLQLITLLQSGIKKSNEYTLAPFLNDLVIVLSKSIVDKSPDVKKASCICASMMARTLPRHFHQQSESLIAPLMTAISHQHSKVRVEAVKAIADVVQFGNNKSVDDVVPHLAQRLFDQAPPVRRAVIQLTGDWLLDLPDRYSFFHRLIPLLMTGFSDEADEIKELAFQYWNDIGSKFEKENENDFKDKLDFPAPNPSHYLTGVNRPNLGCRILMQRNIFKILPALSHDITDWILETRVKSVQLLYWMFINAEDAITQHLLVIFTSLLKAVVDDDKTVASLAVRTAEIVAYFVPADVWSPLMIDHVRQSHGAVGPLTLLAALLRGSEQAQLPASQLKPILTLLTESDICYTLDTSCQIQLVACGSAILSVANETACVEVSFELFSLFLTSLAMISSNNYSGKDEQIETIMKLFEKLGSISPVPEGGGDAKQVVFERHIGHLLDKLTKGHDLWNKHSPQRLVFEALLCHAGRALGGHLAVIVNLLVANLKPEKDAELRLSLFNLLSKLCLKAGETFDSTGVFAPYAHVIVRDGLLPNFVWKPGRTAEAIRLSAVSCLWAVFVQSNLLSQENVSAMKTDLLTQLMSLLSDDQRNTRLVTIRVLKVLFQRVGKEFGQDKLHSLYIDLLKRFDDVNDDVRIALSEAFKAYVDSFDDPYDQGTYASHVDFIYDTLLIHLDDPDARIQEAICGVLKTCSWLNKNALADRVAAVRHKHRNTQFLDELAHFLSS